MQDCAALAEQAERLPQFSNEEPDSNGAQHHAGIMKRARKTLEHFRHPDNSAAQIGSDSEMREGGWSSSSSRILTC